MSLDALFKQAPSAVYLALEPTVAPNNRQDLRCDEHGRLIVTQAGFSTVKSQPGIAVPYKIVKSSSGRLFVIDAVNVGPDCWVWIFDSATLPADGVTNDILPPAKLTNGSRMRLELYYESEPFANGLTVAASTTGNVFDHDDTALLRIASRYI